MTLQQQRELENAYLMPVFARKPVCLVEGRGMHVVDDRGADYLDFIGGIGVCSLGHCHPKVVRAVQEQAAKLMHVSNYYYVEQRGEVACLLSDALNNRLAGPRWRTFFANSGAEANECMIKLARLFARRLGNGGTTIITLEGSFHGRTMETLAATAQRASSLCPAVSSMLPSTTSPPWNISSPSSAARSAPSCSSPSKGRAASIPVRRNSWRRRRTCAGRWVPS